MSLSNIAYRQADGTTVNVGHVEADAQYADMIRRLSRPESMHPSPPYDNAEDMWADVPRQLARRARKAVGLPASSDVALIAELLRQLRLDAETYLHQPINSAVISYPALPGLYEEMISDAADFLRLKPLTGYFFRQPREIYAAYAGHGFGLCDHGNDYEQCRDELLARPSREVLLVDVTETAILLHVQRLQAAIDTGSSDVTASLEAWDFHDGPEQLITSITNVLRRAYAYREAPDEMTVITAGNKGDYGVLVKYIEEAVRSFGPEPEILIEESAYITARGAAQFAWRALQGKTATTVDDAL